MIYEEINACVLVGQITSHVRAVCSEDEGEMSNIHTMQGKAPHLSLSFANNYLWAQSSKECGRSSIKQKVKSQ